MWSCMVSCQWALLSERVRPKRTFRWFFWRYTRTTRLTRQRLLPDFTRPLKNGCPERVSKPMPTVTLEFDAAIAPAASSATRAAAIASAMPLGALPMGAKITHGRPGERRFKPPLRLGSAAAVRADRDHQPHGGEDDHPQHQPLRPAVDQRYGGVAEGRRHDHRDHVEDGGAA